MLARRVFVFEVVEDSLDFGWILDTGDDLHGAAAVRTLFDVDAEYALEASCPPHRAALFRCGASSDAAHAFVAPGRRDPGAHWLFGAKILWCRARLTPGGGTRAASDEWR